VVCLVPGRLYGAAILTAFFVLRKMAKVPLKFNFHTEGVFKIIRESFPYALLIFLMSIYTRADMMLVERLNGKEEAGIYSAAYRLLDVGNIFGLMFANMLLPLFGRMLANSEPTAPIIRVCVNMLLPISFIAAVAAFFYGPEIMHFLDPRAGNYDGAVFAWLIASLPAFCMMYLYSTLLTANGDLKILNGLAAFGVLVNLGCNFYFIPKMGALGAATIAFFTQSILAVGFIIFASKRMSLPFNFKWVLAHIGFLVVIAALGYGVHLAPVKWLAQLFIFGGMCVGGMFLFRFISVGALVKLFKKN
jgi:O-antigen/teichoic acid export membrane protein